MKRFQSLLLPGAIALLLAAGSADLQAQSMGYQGAKLRFGVFGGANFNSLGVGGSNVIEIPGGGSITQKDLSDGTGFGPYGGLLVEYNTGDIIGVHMRASYDDRRATLSNNGRQWDTRLAYVSFEPGLRVNLASPDFALTVGPSLSVNVNKSFDYQPADNEGVAAITDGELQDVKPVTFGMWGGVSYDIHLNSVGVSPQWYLTPFFEGSWMVDQKKADFPDQDNLADVWSTVTVRGGLQLKFGSAPVAAPEEVTITEALPAMDVSLRTPPSGIIESRMLKEYFPLRNYLFFNSGSTDLPNKYVRLNSSQAASFDESGMVEIPGTGDASATRSQRQMSVYYNALNIYATRLRNSPSATITLIGSAPNQSDALAMAESVKSYMVSTFGIDQSRIITKGQKRAPNASGTRVTPKDDLPLVAEENMRVEVHPSDESILRPVEIRSMQEEMGDNDLVLNVKTDVPVASWTVTIAGEGTSNTYGPYYGPIQRIDAKTILQSHQNGKYTATVNAVTQDGKTVVKEMPFTLYKQEAPAASGERYSILFEYDDSKTVQTYDEFLRHEVAPNIPNGSTVFIHGHTDKIGEEDHNMELSTARASATQNVLQDELSKLGRTVTFDSYGFGETEFRAPFANTTPEGRYYNRTVVIDVVPGS